MIIIITVYGITVAMESSDYFLTVEEDNCFDKVNSYPNLCCLAYSKLPISDQEILKHNYCESPEMKNTMARYAVTVFSVFKKFSIEIPTLISADYLYTVFMKVKKAMISSKQYPIGPTTARLWVHDNIVITEELCFLKKENYKKDPQITKQVVQKFASNVMDFLKQEEDQEQKFLDGYKDAQAKEKIVFNKMAAIERLYR